MRNCMSVALLAFAILAGCREEPIKAPYIAPRVIPNNINPIYPAMPLGTVTAPYLALELYEPATNTIHWLKIGLDGLACAPLTNIRGTDLCADGCKMLQTEQDGLYLVNLVQDTKTRVWKEDGYTVYLASISADGNHIAFAANNLNSGSGALYVVDAFEGAVPRMVNTFEKDITVWSAHFSPNNDMLAYSANGIVYVAQLASGNVVRISDYEGRPDPYSMGDRWPLITPDGSHVLLAATSYLIDWEMNGGPQWVLADIADQSEARGTVLNFGVPFYNKGYEGYVPVTFTNNNEFCFVGQNKSGTVILKAKMDGSMPDTLVKASAFGSITGEVLNLRYVSE